MTDRPTSPPADAAALAHLADEVLPALVARLDASSLGELEVRHDGWRVRLRRSPQPGHPAASGGSGSGSGGGGSPDAARKGATSPGVGYFVPNERTKVGREVAAGDVVGWVEVLGVRQEVVSPRDGIVGRYHAEGGQAVEYGQELVSVDAHRLSSADEALTAAAID
ncbi:MAG: biotin/lipoyl-containing protein [Chloroflexota bacterium]